MQSITRTDASPSSASACQKAGLLCTTIRARRRWLVKSLNESRMQPREQLLMNVVESAVTENHDHIFWPQHWNDSIHNGIGAVFVKRRSASLGNRSHNTLWF